jgi:hypothetical protein
MLMGKNASEDQKPGSYKNDVNFNWNGLHFLLYGNVKPSFLESLLRETDIYSEMASGCSADGEEINRN